MPRSATRVTVLDVRETTWALVAAGASILMMLNYAVAAFQASRGRLGPRRTRWISGPIDRQPPLPIWRLSGLMCGGLSVAYLVLGHGVGWLWLVPCAASFGAQLFWDRTRQYVGHNAELI
jgi:hypothetical protein